MSYFRHAFRNYQIIQTIPAIQRRKQMAVFETLEGARAYLAMERIYIGNPEREFIGDTLGLCLVSMTKGDASMESLVRWDIEPIDYPAEW